MAASEIAALAFVLLWIGAGTFGVALVVRSARRRPKVESHGPESRRQRRRFGWLLVLGMGLPLALVVLVSTGYLVAAVWVLIGYVFLWVAFLVLVGTVIAPRVRHVGIGPTARRASAANHSKGDWRCPRQGP